LLLNGNRPYCFGVSVTQLPQRARVVVHGSALDDRAVNEAEHPSPPFELSVGEAGNLATYLLGLGGLLLPSTVPTLLT
jgi:hypothetical protein